MANQYPKRFAKAINHLFDKQRNDIYIQNAYLTPNKIFETYRVRSLI